MSTRTFDNKRKVKPLNLIDVDAAFKSWWDDKLSISLGDTQGNRQKVPVRMIAPERWSLAREEGIRNQEGTLALPIIVIARTGEGEGNEGSYGRIFADTKQDHVYYKEVNDKSSLIKELNDARVKNIDPSLPIYEVYTHKAPDHYTLTYQVSIWTATMEDMNICLQKIGQELDFKSVKSFKFTTPDNFYFIGFQESIEDDSNTSDFTGKERIVRRIITFKVPGYIMPQSDQKRDTFRRYFSQTKLVFKEEVALTNQEYKKLTGK